MFFGNSDIKEEIAQSKIPAVKGENIETEIDITIEDGFYGVEKKITLKDLEGKDKTAYFLCNLVLYHIDGTYVHKEGRTYGTIIEEEKGDTSFGYDCIFLSKDLNKTFGEATSEEKNSVSHRTRALEELRKCL